MSSDEVNNSSIVSLKLLLKITLLHQPKDEEDKTPEWHQIRNGVDWPEHITCKEGEYCSEKAVPFFCAFSNRTPCMFCLHLLVQHDREGNHECHINCTRYKAADEVSQLINTHIPTEQSKRENTDIFVHFASWCLVECHHNVAQHVSIGIVSDQLNDKGCRLFHKETALICFIAVPKQSIHLFPESRCIRTELTHDATTLPVAAGSGTDSLTKKLILVQKLKIQVCILGCVRHIWVDDLKKARFVHQDPLNFLTWVIKSSNKALILWRCWAAAAPILHAFAPFLSDSGNVLRAIRLILACSCDQTVPTPQAIHARTDQLLRSGRLHECLIRGIEDDRWKTNSHPRSYLRPCRDIIPWLSSCLVAEREWHFNFSIANHSFHSKPELIFLLHQHVDVEKANVAPNHQKVNASCTKPVFCTLLGVPFSVLFDFLTDSRI